MDAGLKGKSALITGGASGIGLGIAKSLAEEGVNLAIASRNPEPKAIEELCGMGVKAIAVKADVSDEKQVIYMVKKTIEEFGELDMFVNNAAWSQHEPITKLTTDNFMKTINTNLSACVWGCREASRHMIKRRKGSILIIGSTATYHPLYKESSYRISKTGLVAFMEVLAIELIPFGIRVNMIIPGGFETKMTKDFFVSDTAKILKGEIPMRRFGLPEEVGPSAVLLLSDKLSGYTMGEVLTIDGGVKLHPHAIYTDEDIMKMNEV